MHDAQRIIFSGSNGDDWWVHKQLLAQMDNAISIFEEAHPSCIALFIFDQLSAHASLGADALCAFDMNKENGGSQHIRKDTIFPDNCSNRSVYGQIQRMTMDGGVAKGLQQTLEECSFNVKGICAKCSPHLPNRE